MAAAPEVRFPDAETAWCPTHFVQAVGPEDEAGPDALLWQTRYAIAVIELTTAVMANERIRRRAGWTPDGGQAAVALLTVLLAEASPLCCFLGEGHFAELLLAIQKARGQARLARLKERG